MQADRPYSGVRDTRLELLAGSFELLEVLAQVVHGDPPAPVLPGLRPANAGQSSAAAAALSGEVQMLTGGARR